MVHNPDISASVCYCHCVSATLLYLSLFAQRMSSCSPSSCRISSPFAGMEDLDSPTGYVDRNDNCSCRYKGGGVVVLDDRAQALFLSFVRERQMDYKSLLEGVIDFKSDTKTLAYIEFLSSYTVAELSSAQSINDSVAFCKILTCLCHTLYNNWRGKPMKTKVLFKGSLSPFGTTPVYETDLYWWELAIRINHTCERYVMCLNTLIKSYGCHTESGNETLLKFVEPDALGLIDHLMFVVSPTHLMEPFCQETGIKYERWVTLRTEIEAISLFCLGYFSFHRSKEYQLAARCFASALVCESLPGYVKRSSMTMVSASMGYHHFKQQELDLSNAHFDRTPETWEDKVKSDVKEQITRSVLHQWDVNIAPDDPRLAMKNYKTKVKGVSPLLFYTGFRCQL